MHFPFWQGCQVSRKHIAFVTASLNDGLVIAAALTPADTDVSRDERVNVPSCTYRTTILASAMTHMSPGKIEFKNNLFWGMRLVV